MTKRKTIFLVLAFISFIIFIIFDIRNSHKRLKNFIDNFDLKFKGVIIDIRYHDHGGAYVKIKVIESNMTEYKDPKYLGFDYCNFKNGIANMDAPSGHALEIGDSVFVGPSDYFVSKCGNDTIIGRESTWDDLTYRRYNEHRDY